MSDVAAVAASLVADTTDLLSAAKVTDCVFCLAITLNCIVYSGLIWRGQLVMLCLQMGHRFALHAATLHEMPNTDFKGLGEK